MSRNLKDEVVPTSYRASIEDENLETFIADVWIEAKDLEEISERQTQEFVEESCKRKINGVQLYLIEDAIKVVSLQKYITNAKTECGRSIGSIAMP